MGGLGVEERNELALGAGERGAVDGLHAGTLGLVELLVDETRTCDYLGRLADDRLLAILPHTDKPGGETLATRILAAGRKRNFAGPSGPLQITLSVGLSHYEDDNTLFFDALVESAELALEEASAEGGDRYVHRDPAPRED